MCLIKMSKNPGHAGWLKSILFNIINILYHTRYKHASSWLISAWYAQNSKHEDTTLLKSWKN